MLFLRAFKLDPMSFFSAAGATRARRFHGLRRVRRNQGGNKC